ncbi:TPA: hypothetical protein LSH87_003747 [Citrobacter koseri]|uniref:hypothetical protein n=1 Tax=Citrobacter koseri TaxID=545 RepID=UPI0023AE98C6|nr:hypothetical protein [Citrobacter koseri]HBL6925838.1 hypothetical protein [Citrobacter koseri]HBL6930741.1 hypothetical protein [Citrobacter koseri]
MCNDELPPKCPDIVVGSLLRIVHCCGAWDSFTEALKRTPTDRHDSLKAQMNLLVQRLANGARLSKDSFPPEGLLPCLPGKQAKSFYAFKKIPIRAYGWYSERHSKTFFISHYIYKSKDKLSKKDTTRVQGNWTRIEVDGDEK